MPGDIQIVDYARPFHSVTTDYANLILILARDSVPTSLLGLEPHGFVFPHGSGAARLIGAAMQEFYAQADDLTVGEAEAAIEGIVAPTTAFARMRLAGDKLDRVKSKRKAAFDYIDAHFANARLGPDEIAAAAHLSRASLYRLLAAEGGIRSVLLKRRLDQALRLMLDDGGDECSLKEIVKCCGFGGKSQFSRAFHARFGLPPRQYRALVRQQDFDWRQARLKADGFDHDFLFWRTQRVERSCSIQYAVRFRGALRASLSAISHARLHPALVHQARRWQYPLTAASGEYRVAKVESYWAANFWRKQKARDDC